jgi:predicted ester cyclase/ribosomal protein S18 acetylase RimI-like enzyme
VDLDEPLPRSGQFGAPLYGSRFRIFLTGELAVTAHPHRELVHRYYHELWNAWNFPLAGELLSQGINFRGSLGVTVEGLPAFLGYMRMVQTAFPDFNNAVEDAVAESNQVFAQLTYRGTHRGDLFGIAPTGRSISYTGAALFTIHQQKIAAARVLGDALGLLHQLQGAAASHTSDLNGARLEIAPASPADRQWGAPLMAANDPWKTLGRDLPACIRVFEDRTMLPFIARIDGGNAGFLLLRHRGVVESPYIKSMGVAEKFRSRGIGARMLAFAEDLYRAEASSIFICCSSFNPRALQLYQRCGYKVVGQLADYVVPGVAELLLEKRLR